MFWVRLRAIGPCEPRKLEQFAVLSYAPPSVNSMRLAYPNRAFPEYSQIFGQGRVRRIQNKKICIFTDGKTFSFSTIPTHHAHQSERIREIFASPTCRHSFHNPTSQASIQIIGFFSATITIGKRLTTSLAKTITSIS